LPVFLFYSIPMQELHSSPLSGNVVSTDDLREDIVVETSDVEKRRIIDSFPKEKNNYLVVPRVIEE